MKNRWILAACAAFTLALVAPAQQHGRYDCAPDAHAAALGGGGDSVGSLPPHAGAGSHAATAGDRHVFLPMAWAPAGVQAGETYPIAGGTVTFGMEDLGAASRHTISDPRPRVYRTKWKDVNGLEHEVETPRGPNETPENHALRHADGVTALSRQFPPA